MKRRGLIRVLGVFLCLTVLSLSACSTVTIRDKGTQEVTSEPNYQEMKLFFVGGLFGSAKVNVSEVCKGSKPVQMRTQTRFVDGLIELVTGSLVTPRTASVWCAAKAGGAK